tara:strand:+ start:24 stop:146 length:123 start_codon:yes stop_codon:yes gene_type:complete
MPAAAIEYTQVNDHAVGAAESRLLGCGRCGKEETYGDAND